MAVFGIDDMAFALLASGAMQGIGGALSGPSQRQPSYWEDVIAREQGRGLKGQNRLFNETFPEQVKRFGLQNAALGLQNQLSQQLFGQRGIGFQRRGETFGLAKGQLGQQIYDPSKTLGLAMRQLQPYMDKLSAGFAKRGFGGGGAEMGALANLQSRAGLQHLMGGYQQNALAMAQRDQNLLGLMGGLYG